MTYLEAIQTNYGDVKELLTKKYGGDSDALMFFKAMDTGKTSRYNRISTKRKHMAAQQVWDCIDHLEDYWIDYYIMISLYEDCYLTEAEFYGQLLKWPKEAYINLPNDMTSHRIYIVPVLIPVNKVKHVLKIVFDEWFQWTDDDLNTILWNRLSYLAQQGYIQYQLSYFEDEEMIEVQMLKNPYYYEEQNHKIQKQQDEFHLEERFEPISISESQNKIRDILYNNNIPFMQEYSVSIGDKQHRFDIAIFNPTTGGIDYFIEYDGEQHFKPIDKFGGEAGLKERKLKDQQKNEYCEKNHIPLIRIPYTEHHIELTHLIPKYSKYVR